MHVYEVVNSGEIAVLVPVFDYPERRLPSYSRQSNESVDVGTVDVDLLNIIGNLLPWAGGDFPIGIRICLYSIISPDVDVIAIESVPVESEEEKTESDTPDKHIYDCTFFIHSVKSLENRSISHIHPNPACLLCQKNLLLSEAWNLL